MNGIQYYSYIPVGSFTSAPTDNRFNQSEIRPYGGFHGGFGHGYGHFGGLGFGLPFLAGAAVGSALGAPYGYPYPMPYYGYPGYYY
ncbi:MAG: hypothetical protein FWE36_04240 [Erysipelotrichales bacterium]|nr:hypothetical protein [Erysipelotrichales bacterium]